MPIYAPTLPPRPDLSQGHHPTLILARFDLRRIWRQKIGRFFSFGILIILIVKIAVLYFKHLVDTHAGWAQAKDFTKYVLPEPARFQAELLPAYLLYILWFLIALVGGGLVARDTHFRTRPLMYAHPVRPLDYILAKMGLASAFPFVLLLPFIFLPWALSLALGGAAGPVWMSAPLRLLPAALAISLLMGAVSAGASSLASTPRAGVGWVLGIVLGSNALANLLAIWTHQEYLRALSVMDLAITWPLLCCGVEKLDFTWIPVLVGTFVHLSFWIWILARNSRPDEAVL